MKPRRTHPSFVVRRAVIGAVLLIGVMILSGAPVQGTPGEALEILRKAVLAQGNVTYSSVGRVTGFGPGGPRASTQIVFRKSGGKERIKIQGFRGETLWLRVCDGKTVWEQHMGPWPRLFIRTLPPPHHIRERELFNLRMLAANYDVTLVGIESLAERKAYHIRIATKSSPVRVVREVWIDQSKHIELKTQAFGPDGRLFHMVVLDRVNFAPSFDQHTFSFQVPPGVRPHVIPPPRFVGSAEAAGEKAGFRPMPPRRVPPGFALYANMVAVSDVKGVTTLWYQYTDGIRQFSVFQRQVPPGRKSPRRGLGWARTFEAGGYHFTVVGPLSPQEYEIIRTSYQPTSR